MAGQTRLVIEPASTRYEATDREWQRQKITLARSLRSAGVSDLRRGVSHPGGHKGAADAIVVTLISTGAIGSVVEILRLWLGRDRTRRIALTVEKDGKLTVVTLDAETASDRAIATIMTAAIKHSEADTSAECEDD